MYLVVRADIYLHWLLFKQNNLNLDNVQQIGFWKRFIDDCGGVWRGTKRQFFNFVKNLNKETNKVGINFPINEIKFGKSVDFLDITLYLDDTNNIQYKSYSKQTDASSFHPQHVFKSVPKSQMIRMFNINSNPETLVTQMEELKRNLVKSGYKKEKVEEIENELRGLDNGNNMNTESHSESTITFPLYYFDGLKEFKQLVYQLETDLKLIIGDTKIVFATKKGRSVGNTVIRNKNLSMTPSNNNSDQKCNTYGCMQCPLVVTTTQ